MMKYLGYVAVGFFTVFCLAQVVTGAPGDKVFPVSQGQFKNRSAHVQSQISSLLARPSGGGDVSFDSLSAYAKKKALENLSTATQAKLNDKETTGVASGLIVSHNANGASHSGHFTSTSNPHSVTAAQVGSPTNSKMTNESTARNAHAVRIDNPHSVTPPQVFGNPTGVRYPKFTGSGNWQWERPLEACGSNPATAIYDGAPGRDSLFCQFSSLTGNTAITYDKNGLNPLPSSLTSFILKVYHGAVEVVAQTITYWTGGSSNRVYGSGTGSRSFTASIKPRYSQYSSNNQVFAMAMYSSIYGKQYCRTSAAIAVNKIGGDGGAGATGPAGPVTNISVGTVTNLVSGSTPYVTFTGTTTAKLANFGLVRGADGDPGTISQGQILDKIKEVSTAVLERSTNGADTDVLFQIKDSAVAHNVRLFITASGLIYSKDANGKVRWGFDSVNNKHIMGNYSAGSPRRNYEVDTFGQVRRFATNGTTVIYQSYTTGREKWFSTAGKLQRHKFPDGKVITYRPDGVTPAFTNNTSAAMVIGG